MVIYEINGHFKCLIHCSELRGGGVLLSSKYHMSTIIAIFLALGMGILIGGTLGQQWVYQTEDRLVDLLMNRYEDQLSVNQLLQKQITSLQLMNQTTSVPLLQNRKIGWIRPEDAHNDLLAFVMKSAGADWSEFDADIVQKQSAQLFNQDVILISEPEFTQSEQSAMNKLDIVDTHPKWIAVQSEVLRFNEPEEAVNFILYVKQMLEEDTHAAASVYRYPGVERK